MQEQFNPYGLGIALNPPSLFVFYNSEKGKRRRKIPLRSIQAAIKAKNKSVDVDSKNKSVDVDSVSNQLAGLYAQYLGKISKVQLKNIIQKVVNHHKLDLPISALPSLPEKDAIATKENLNIVSDDELKRAKKAMDAVFEKNRITKDNPSFQYDIKKDFGKPVLPNEWDSSSEEEEDKSKAAAKKATPSESITPASNSTLACTTTASALNAVPQPAAAAKKAKDDSLVDDLDSLLDSFEVEEKPKKKKVTISPDSKEDGKTPLTKSLNPQPKPMIQEEKKEIVKPLSNPIQKSLLGGLPPLTSLQSLPPLSGLKPIKKPTSSEVAVSETVVPSNSSGDIVPDQSIQSILNEASEKLEQVELKTQPEVITANVLDSAKKQVELKEKPVESKVSADVKNVNESLQSVPAFTPPVFRQAPQSIQPKSGKDDVSEDIVEDDFSFSEGEEDEEFANLIGKKKLANSLEKTPLKDTKDLAKDVSVKDAVKDTIKEPIKESPKPTENIKNTSEKVIEKKEDVLASKLASVDAAAASIAEAMKSLDPKPKSTKATPGIAKKDEYNYEDDFELGHTDDEIVFSDDGLSIGSADKDDIF